MLINSYTQQLYYTTKVFKVYLNNNPTPVISNDIITIPTTTNPPKLHLCGLENNGDVTEGSHVDISHFQIYTPTGGMYQEIGGNEL